MTIEPRETVILKRTCGDECCGQEVWVKCNKNMMAYYFCDHCSFHQKWGRESSQRLIRQYRETRKAQAGKPRNIVTKPKPQTTQKEPTNVKATDPANLNRSPDDRGTFDRLFG